MKNIILLLTIIGLTSCKDKPKTTTEQGIKGSNVMALLAQEISQDASTLLKTKCYSCHDPNASHQQRIAPPMAAIKARYLKDYLTKQEFTNAIWAFVEKPSKEKAKMKGAINRFGVMPYQPYNEEDIRLISDFIFDYQIEEPSWFKKHWEERHGEGSYQQKGKKLGNTINTHEKNYVEIELTYANNTKKILGQNLMGTIQNKGTVAALDFCNERAYPLTDSISKVHNAIIKRVTDKPRNPANQANSIELGHIDYFKNVVAANEKYEPIIEEDGKGVNFYYPIITNSLCLQCHGEIGSDIRSDVVNNLKIKYPMDEAVGYRANEVRGVWSIYFKKNEQ
ncbi:c-type heme family protein [Maribacter sp. CXY002]|uniref:c-type heme family protein n=1 Tax=Maribacter luteocoastalis TaxID=3407671 RepID=UPI003B679FFC